MELKRLPGLVERCLLKNKNVVKGTVYHTFVGSTLRVSFMGLIIKLVFNCDQDWLGNPPILGEDNVGCGGETFTQPTIAVAATDRQVTVLLTTLLLYCNDVSSLVHYV